MAEPFDYAQGKLWGRGFRTWATSQVKVPPVETGSEVIR
jgi:hypothetical protein